MRRRFQLMVLVSMLLLLLTSGLAEAKNGGGGYSTVLFNYEWIADRQTIYRFKLPQSNNNRVSEKNIRLLWEGLERLPSGTAAEMAFSLDNYYDLKEVPKLPGEHLVI
ncbi:MAG: hypothetical protein PHY90_11670, partial [Desulfitobacteriaceae bacterium]|nr:hypothetical protein [Desulfitobacteriaceae bacterium]